MKKLLPFVLGLTLSISCNAQDILYLGQISHHHGEPEEVVREKHALIIYESNGWMGGYWRNSYDRDTFSLGYHHVVFGNNDYNIGIKGGIVTGYQYPVFGTINIQLPFIDINWIPNEVIGIGFKYTFGD